VEIRRGDRSGGPISTVALAAHQIAINLASLTFMVACSVSPRPAPHGSAMPWAAVIRLAPSGPADGDSLRRAVHVVFGRRVSSFRAS
jgi:hypothetical protein